MLPAMRSARQAPQRGAAALSHIGLIRATNEDAVYVGGDGRLLVCADGLGGLPFGEVASRLAVAHVVEELEPRLAGGSPRAFPGWPNRLRQAFFGAHDRLVAAGRERGVVGGIGTALIVAVTTARRAHVCHVGDVRGYRWSRGELVRITDDHSVVFDAVRSGALTVEQARRHPKRNFVTQALGLPDGIAPSMTTVPVAAGDLLVLCSDGLWETMPEEQLAVSLDLERSPRTIAESLIERALGAGGPDNASVVVYRHGRS
jgi:serine/threonine protein phosphatase PrpC